MGAKSSRQYTYQQYYEEMKKSGNTENINMENIDPYEVFSISKNFTWNELKETYRKLAINTHPDKPGGNKEVFNIITYCFEKLAREYKKRESDLSHIELKKQSMDYFDKIVNDKNILSKAEIANLKSQLKKLEKEKKLLINKMKEPKSIIDYVNKCFTGKK